jgi:hypothetical protein
VDSDREKRRAGGIRDAKGAGRLNKGCTERGERREGIHREGVAVGTDAKRRARGIRDAKGAGRSKIGQWRLAKQREEKWREKV